MAASASHQVAKPDIPIGSQWLFFGSVYPDTAAGLGACNSEGIYLVVHAPANDKSWECRLNSPDAGYDLWVLYESPEE
jgi:hypothetical protein